MSPLARELEEGEAVGEGVDSFPAGTRILLANGKTKSIEKVKVGDKIKTTDPKTGKTVVKKVTASFGGKQYDHLVQIAIDTGDKHGHHTGTITATEHHKFWNPINHAWIRADQLTPGTVLRTLGVETVHVLHAYYAFGHPTVYDLTIASLHTFYVEAGTTPVLVHNEGDCPKIGREISRQKQARHVRGDRLYAGGGYFTDPADAQRVLDAYHSGDATVLGTSRTGNVVVRYGAVTGYNNNPTAGYLDQETNIFMIKGTKSPSVVPINPNWSGG